MKIRKLSSIHGINLAVVDNIMSYITDSIENLRS